MGHHNTCSASIKSRVGNHHFVQFTLEQQTRGYFTGEELFGTPVLAADDRITVKFQGRIVRPLQAYISCGIVVHG